MKEWVKATLMFIAIFIGLAGVIVAILWLLGSGAETYVACSPGYDSVCIDANQKSDFEVKDGCITNKDNPSDGQVCGSYSIEEVH